MRILIFSFAALLTFFPAWAQEASPPLPEWLQYKSQYAGEQADKNQPHRTAAEIMTWVQDNATNAMSFTPETAAAKLGAVKPLFTTQGWQEFSSHLRNSKLLDAVQAQGYGISTIANGEAAMINQGAVAGSYRWLVTMPVIISFTKVAADGLPETVTGGNLKLTVQVGRTTGDVTQEGLAIESWKAETLR